jgi:hypothetical protein
MALLCGFALGGSVAVAQTYHLTGRILDKVDLRPVAGARVEIPASGLKAVTGTDGRFALQGTAAIRGNAAVFIAAPYFRNGMLHVQAAFPGSRVRVELFGLLGERRAAGEYPLAQGWNRLRVLPYSSQESSQPSSQHSSQTGSGSPGYHGFARITVEGGTWIKRILDLEGPAGIHWSEEASATATAAFAASTASTTSTAYTAYKRAQAPAKASGGNLVVSADRLAEKSVPLPMDSADLGDIVLDNPPRKLDVGAPAIYGAAMLFDGSKGKAAALAEIAAKWRDWTPVVPASELAKYNAAVNTFKLAKDPQYPDDTSRVTLQACCNTLWGYDDLQAIAPHGDAQNHVEFNGMGEYDAGEQTNGADPIDETPVKPGYYNSGVYVQSRYELQIRAFSQDKSLIPGIHDMASLVDDYAPAANANRPHGQWQAYDITFRAARYDSAGKKLDDARISLWWNGVLVHDNRVAHGTATGTAADKHSGEELGPKTYGLKLQSEGRDVRFRNIWIKELAIPDPRTNFGY